MGGDETSELIERMLDVMLCLPRSAWGLVLVEVEKKIGTAALQRIILRVCDKCGSHMIEKVRARRHVALIEKRGAARD
jgi:hypothetical protein